MSGIDEVIERSRQPGEFAERKRFTVARSSAIQKMRKFALADPSYYILEWIQAAIANGATYLDLAIDGADVRMSYVGGGFSRGELEALFDFLFASKDDLEVADARQLALGVNALLSAKPEMVVIESGDGTLEGTTRVEISGRTDSVDVGTPLEPLEGTYVRAVGLHRSVVQPKELQAIEERCLTATIPILVNDVPLFGYTTVRSPELFGYRRTLKFDEGDLYGTLGIATTPITRNVKLLTWGTWINTTRHEFPDSPPIGGVVGYDRLRKTADHASIVQDEVYKEMWARLEPYARQLASGETGKATFDVRLLEGTDVSARQFRELVREWGRAVVFPDSQVRTELDRELAERFGVAFDAPVFLVGKREHDNVRHLGGPEVQIHAPPLDESELLFYERPVATDPPRPWLTGALDVPGMEPAELVRRIDLGLTHAIASRAGARLMRAVSSVGATVFTPAASLRDVEMWAEVRVAGRVAWAGNVSTSYPGHHLVIDLDNVSPSELEDQPEGVAVGEVIAHAVAEYAEPVLAQASRRVIDSIDPKRMTIGTSRIVLAMLAQRALKRVRSRDGVAQIRFALDGEDLPDVLLDVPVLRTAAGAELSLHDLEVMLPATYGLVYGTLNAATLPEAIDRSRVLLLDRPTEVLVSALIGSHSYVRLGDDALLAGFESGGFAPGSRASADCREFAAGLREYPDLPILIEGTVPADRSACLTSLASQLLYTWRKRTGSRHVLRHLIWFAMHGDGPIHEEVLVEPLFRAPDGRPLSFQNIRAALESDKGLPMFDGWSADIMWGHPGADEVLQESNVALAMDPFLLYVLREHGRIRPILDIDLSLTEARNDTMTPGTAFLESEQIVGLEGTIGLPMQHVDDPVVLLLDRQRGTASALRQVGRDYGVVGRIRATPAVHDSVVIMLGVEEVEHRCIAVAQGLYDRLIRRLSAMKTGTEEYQRALEILLTYAGRRVRITESPDGRLGVTCVDLTAQRVLDLPIFPTTAGVSVPPMRLLREFAIYGDGEPRPGRSELDPAAPAVLRRWLTLVLEAEATAVHPQPVPVAGPQTHLGQWLTETLASLRTDPENDPIEIRLVPPEAFYRWIEQFGMDPNVDLFVSNDTVFIKEGCWLTDGLVDAEDRPVRARAAWLLLAAYARVNELRLAVTNVHEMHFQSRVVDWLERGG